MTWSDLDEKLLIGGFVSLISALFGGQLWMRRHSSNKLQEGENTRQMSMMDRSAEREQKAIDRADRHHADLLLERAERIKEVTALQLKLAHVEAALDRKDTTYAIDRANFAREIARYEEKVQRLSRLVNMLTERLSQDDPEQARVFAKSGLMDIEDATALMKSVISKKRGS